MRSFLALILGIGIGAAAVWYFGVQKRHARLHTPAQDIQRAARSAGDALQQELRSLHLTRQDITNELARTGHVIRQKAQAAGEKISNAAADARITAAIKAKLVRDPDLSAWDISVNTTGGVVTLSGRVSSPEKIGKAMLLALDTDGVKQVVSSIQVRSPDAK